MLCKTEGARISGTVSYYTASGVGSHVSSCRLVDFESSEHVPTAQYFVVFLLELRVRRSVRV